VNVEPAAGVAVKVTSVPTSNEAEQLEPQSIPSGELVTEPDPVPDLDTPSVSVDTVSNVAVTDSAALIVTWQVPVPEHPPPDQPVNVEPAAGVAVSVTTVPSPNRVEQLELQSIPAGLLVTVPLPVVTTLSVTGRADPDSYAPMSQTFSPSSGRRKPRWSVDGHRPVEIGTSSIAALFEPSAVVCVGPPLSASESRLMPPVPVSGAFTMSWLPADMPQSELSAAL
jgi:hypothetical protein